MLPPPCQLDSASLHLAAAGRRMQEKTKPLLRASSRQADLSHVLYPAMPARFRFAPSRCGWSPYARKDKTPSASKLASGVPSFLAHGSSGFHMMIHTIPPLQSLTIFCMVSWSLTWHSSPIMEILLVMPSLTSCSTVFPKMLVSQMPSSSFRASEM